MVRAVLFDVFGTLLDVYAVTQRGEQLYPGYGARLAGLWRDKQIEYSRLRTMSSRYVPFSQITRDALEYALDALSLPADAASLKLLIAEYDRLTPFDDVIPSLRRLQDADVALGVLSNGDPPMLEKALSSAGLRSMLRWCLSADEVQSFKTSNNVYALGPRAVGCDAGQIAFVSSNGWDACGAAWYGYASFWVNRDGRPAERLGVALQGTGATLSEAANFILNEQHERSDR